jgi:hypothetical protein
MWFNREHLGMYSKLSLGLTLAINGQCEAMLLPAFQTSAVSMEFGGKALRGFLETGWGNQGLLNFGMKFSF